MAIAVALPGFNDLRRSVTPAFLLVDHFLENLMIISLNFLQNAPSNSVYFLAFFCTVLLKWRNKVFVPASADTIQHVHKDFKKQTCHQ